MKRHEQHILQRRMSARIHAPSKPRRAKSTLYFGRVPKSKHDFLDMKRVRSTKISSCFREGRDLKYSDRRGGRYLTAGAGTKRRTGIFWMGVMLVYGHDDIDRFIIADRMRISGITARQACQRQKIDAQYETDHFHCWSEGKKLSLFALFQRIK